MTGCEKENDDEKVFETGTVTDVEGNIYKTIKIGGQWWMQENLEVKKYNDSTSVVPASTDADWSGNIIGAWCQYNSTNPPPGLLYNWFAVNNPKKLAPAGWHIPTDADWKRLEQNLGMTEADANKLGWRGGDEGNQIRIESPKVWKSYDGVWSTNESGFTALAGGCRLFNGTWSIPNDLGSAAFWWSSTEQSSGESYYRYLDYKNTGVFRSHALKNYGFSVRCVKD